MRRHSSAPPLQCAVTPVLPAPQNSPQSRADCHRLRSSRSSLTPLPTLPASCLHADCHQAPLFPPSPSLLPPSPPLFPSSPPLFLSSPSPFPPSPRPTLSVAPLWQAWVPPLAAQQWGQTTTAGIVAGMMLGASREAARTQASSPFSMHNSHHQQQTAAPPSTTAAPSHSSHSARYATARLAAERRLVRVVRASVAGGAQLGALAGVFSASQLGLRALMLEWREEGVAQRRRTQEGGGSSSSSSSSGRSGEEGVGGSSRGWQGEELCEPDVASSVGAGAVTAGLVGLVATRASPAHRLKAGALHTVAGAALAFPLGESHLLRWFLRRLNSIEVIFEVVFEAHQKAASPAHRLKAAALHTVAGATPWLVLPLPSHWVSGTHHLRPALTCQTCSHMPNLLSHAKPALTCQTCSHMPNLLSHAKPALTCQTCSHMPNLLSHAKPALTCQTCSSVCSLSPALTCLCAIHMLALASLQCNCPFSSCLPFPSPPTPQPTPSNPSLSLCAPPAALLHSALYSLLPQHHSTAAQHTTSETSQQPTPPAPSLSLCAPPAALLHSALYSLLPQQHSTAAAHGSSGEGEGAQGIPQERSQVDSQVGSGSSSSPLSGGGSGGGVAGAIERMEERFMGSFGHLGGNHGGGRGGGVVGREGVGGGEARGEASEGEAGGQESCTVVAGESMGSR
ncbi:unnamed protein product [Closterium sp. NIES-65]|nr:unnamed protein product [Closterium sp. NIES-65]